MCVCVYLPSSYLYFRVSEDPVIQLRPVGVHRLRDAVRALAGLASKRGEEREVEAGGLGELDVGALLQEVGAADELVHGVVAHRGQALADLRWVEKKGGNEWG